jgi:hypothetical protein
MNDRITVDQARELWVSASDEELMTSPVTLARSGTSRITPPTW